MAEERIGYQAKEGVIYPERKREKVKSIKNFYCQYIIPEYALATELHRKTQK